MMYFDIITIHTDPQGVCQLDANRAERISELEGEVDDLKRLGDGFQVRLFIFNHAQHSQHVWAMLSVLPIDKIPSNQSAA